MAPFGSPVPLHSKWAWVLGKKLGSSIKTQNFQGTRGSKVTTWFFSKIEYVKKRYNAIYTIWSNGNLSSHAHICRLLNIRINRSPWRYRFSRSQKPVPF